MVYVLFLKLANGHFHENHEGEHFDKPNVINGLQNVHACFQGAFSGSVNIS